MGDICQLIHNTNLLNSLDLYLIPGSISISSTFLNPVPPGPFINSDIYTFILIYMRSFLNIYVSFPMFNSYWWKRLLNFSRTIKKIILDTIYFIHLLLDHCTYFLFH